MRVLNLQHSQSLPVWLIVPVWLVVFLSPTAFVLLLIIMARLQVPVLGEVVVLLFCLLPVVALLACGTLLWRLKISLGWRIGGLVLTVLAMLFQCGIWFVILLTAIQAAIALVQ